MWRDQRHHDGAVACLRCMRRALNTVCAGLPPFLSSPDAETADKILLWSGRVHEWSRNRKPRQAHGQRDRDTADTSPCSLPPSDVTSPPKFSLYLISRCVPRHFPKQKNPVRTWANKWLKENLREDR